MRASYFPVAFLCLAAPLLNVRPLFAGDPDIAVDDLIHESWGPEAGLPDAVVTATAETPDGFIWVGTAGGLVRFDGAGFQRVRLSVPNRPGADIITSLQPTRDGLWVGTRAGLFYVAQGEGRGNPRRQELPQNSVEALELDGAGTLWIGTRAGLVALSGDKTRHWTRRDGLSHEVIRCLAADRQGLWAGTMGGGLIRMEGTHFRHYRTKDGLPSDFVLAVRTDANGTIWAATSRGVASFGSGRFHGHPRVPSVAAYSLLPDPSGALWVGHHLGLSRLRNDTIEHLKWKDTSRPPVAWATIFDRRGHLWFGSLARGLHRLRAGSFLRTRRVPGLTDRLAHAFLPAGDGSVWLGTEAGLFRMTDRVHRWSSKDGLPNERVTVVTEDPGGGIWVGTGGGLAKLEGRRVVRSRFGPDLDGQAITDLAADGAGALWIGATTGLVRWDGQRATNVTEAAGLGGVAVIDLLRAQDGSLWVSTVNGGVHQYSSGKWRHFGTADGLPKHESLSLSEDSTGAIWCGGYGLARFNGSRFVTIDETQGLPAGRIDGVIDDRRGYLWLAGHGVTRLSRRELEDVVFGRRDRVSGIQFDDRDGMPSSVCVGGGGNPFGRDRLGRLWFATAMGFAVLDPGQLRRPRAPVDVQVEWVHADGQRLSGQRVTLPAGNKQLLIHFAAPSLEAGPSTRFRYRLEGHDEEWVDAGDRREAVYTGLRPGSYRLRLSSATEPGMWRESSASLVLEQEPSFHQTRWFIIAVLTGVAALGLLAHRMHLNWVRRQFDRLLEERLEERARIARELHDTLLQGFTGVVWHLEAVIQRLPAGAEARIQLTALVQRMEMYLREARDSVWDIRNGAGDSTLRGRIQSIGEKLTAETSILFHVEMSDPEPQMPANTQAQLLRVAQEAIANAVRHARPTRILATVVAHAEAIQLRIEDDGIGFDPARVPDGHFGLIGLRERATEAGGKVSVRSTPETGTVVELIVPQHRFRGVEIQRRTRMQNA